VTHSPRVAALRETAYVLIAGVFCLVTLVCRTPLTQASTVSMATFGDPKRERAFEHAWRDIPEYRLRQRLLTASLGLVMLVTSIIKAYILLSTPDDQIAHAVDVCNILTFVMIGTLVVVSAVLIQRPKKIIERLLEQT
jgi:cytochrome bd-type quinol oxidase subunit 2